MTELSGAKGGPMTIPVFHIQDKHLSYQVDVRPRCLVLDKPEDVDILIGMDRFCSHRIRVNFSLCNSDAEYPADWTELCHFSYVPDDKSACAAMAALIRKDQVNRAEEVLDMFMDQLPGCVTMKRAYEINDNPQFVDTAQRSSKEYASFLVDQMQEAAKKGEEAQSDLQDLEIFKDFNRQVIMGLVEDGVAVTVIKEDAITEIPGFRRVVSPRFNVDVCQILVDPEQYLLEPLGKLCDMMIREILSNLGEYKLEDRNCDFVMTPVKVDVQTENFDIKIAFYCLVAGKPKDMKIPFNPPPDEDYIEAKTQGDKIRASYIRYNEQSQQQTQELEAEIAGHLRDLIGKPVDGEMISVIRRRLAAAMPDIIAKAEQRRQKMAESKHDMSRLVDILKDLQEAYPELEIEINMKRKHPLDEKLDDARAENTAKQILSVLQKDFSELDEATAEELLKNGFAPQKVTEETIDEVEECHGKPPQDSANSDE